VELLAGASAPALQASERSASAGGPEEEWAGGGAVVEGSTSSSSSSSSSSGGGRGESESAEEPAGGSGEGSSSLSPFRAALLSADGACVAVKEAETALARAVSLQRSLPGQVKPRMARMRRDEKGCGCCVLAAVQSKILFWEDAQKYPNGVVRAHIDFGSSRAVWAIVVCLGAGSDVSLRTAL